VNIGVIVRDLLEAELDSWSRFLATAPGGSIYSSPGYLGALCRHGGGSFTVVAALRGEALVGGVALHVRPSRFGPWVGPRPFLHYNGIVLAPHATRYPSERTGRDLATLAALAESIAARGLGATSLHSTPPIVDVRPFLAAGWTATPRYTYIVQLRDLPAQWERVEQNLRRLVRRCERSGVVVEDADDPGELFQLHAAAVGHHGVPPYLPRDAFCAFVAELRALGLCRVYLARLPDGRAIAGQLVLTGAFSTTHTVVAGADPAHRESGVSAFLRWRVFESLAAAGYLANDLTDATLGSVTHFKSQFGGELVSSLEIDAPRSARFRLGSLVRRGLQGLRRQGKGARRRAS
jgi:hypothetical protein